MRSLSDAPVSNALLAAAALLLIAARSGTAAPVLMISVDGMRPEYVLEAAQRGVKVPYLKSLMSDGSYAQGVTGVWPTVTYPSHTTLVTGVSPAEHGIFSNLEFDPGQTFKASWYWYAGQIRVPTLWSAVHSAHLSTASVGWPVTVGATDIDYLIPEYWRLTAPTEDLNPSDRHMIAAVSRPVDLLARMQRSLGPYLMGNDTSVQGDETKSRFLIDILRKYRPAFTTLHLSSLDVTEHTHGAFSAQAIEDMEAIDRMLADISAAARANIPDVVIAVVSDHGFAQLTHQVNLYIPFLQAGLITPAQDPNSQPARIASWKAQPWLAGGMAAVMLHDPADRETQQRVAALLLALAADPHNGIARIEDRAGLGPLGAFPDAAFLVIMQPGYYTGAGMTGDLVTDIRSGRGGHGFSPDYPDMRASFFIAGPGIARGRNLGIIDMRRIAPSLAHVLGVALPTSHAEPLNLTR